MMLMITQKKKKKETPNYIKHVATLLNHGACMKKKKRFCLDPATLYWQPQHVPSGALPNVRRHGVDLHAILVGVQPSWIRPVIALHYDSETFRGYVGNNVR